MRQHGIERMLRDARINRIVEGATEVMTAFIALVGMKGVGEQFESVLRASKHPIGNFGRLAEFAHSQWSDIVIGPHFNGLHRELAAEGHALADLTKHLARSVGRLLRRYKHDILDMELLHQRVAWSAVDLYAMAAVISKLQASLSHAEGNGHSDIKRDLLLGKSFCHNAAERITQRLHGLFHNRDDETLRVADNMLAES
jgi:acyl-CoA dehydrogenase family protein 9